VLPTDIHELQHAPQMFEIIIWRLFRTGENEFSAEWKAVKAQDFFMACDHNRRRAARRVPDSKDILGLCRLQCFPA